MNLGPRLTAFLAAIFLAGTALEAAVPRDFAVDLKATVSTTVPCIVLSWTQRVQTNISAQKIHRRLKGAATWVLQATLTTTQTSYTDNTALPGVEYEYWMERTFTGLSPNTAMGYISAGVEVPFAENRGTLLLVIDDTMVAPLAPEIAQLQQDLVGDGWTVQTISAPRAGTAISTKALIQSAYNADPANVKMVYLLGHVPVPYSGQIAPDGHGDHVGAWPADGYYGDMNGTWTDTTINDTSASRTQNDNIPGDGKFDQSYFPSALELMVGRVDLRNMTRAPVPTVTEFTLLRRYLRKAHEYRHKLGAYASIPRRTIIRDGFGHAFSSEPFAVTGWSQAFTSVSNPPAAPIIDEPASGLWFSASYAGGNSYLMGHGDGGGSYESASTVGNTADFGRKPSRVVFTSLFGSYHGDWDADNCFLRAPLAGNATGDSLGLVCFWAGRPNWFMHHMGMGETFGYSTRFSQNAGIAFSATPGGSSFGGVHTGLMGDPALRLHMVEPPRNLGLRNVGGTVNLQWSAATEPGIIGYHVYRGQSAAGPLTRLTTTAQTATTYVDPVGASVGSTYVYVVRALKLDAVPGGSYYNPSQGSMITLTPTATTGTSGEGPVVPGSLTVTPYSGVYAYLTWVDNSSNETAFRVERKTNAGGTYTKMADLSANVTAWADINPSTSGDVYYYRVIATGPGGDSLPSTEASFEASAGFFDLSTTTKKVNKSAGTATYTVNRFGGVTGAVSVTCATSNSSAVAGTHYTATTTVLNWADGENAAKTFTVPITHSGTPKLPRQFKVTLSNPTGGTAIALAANTATLIEDPSGTLPEPWSQTMLGSVTDSSPAVMAEGMLGFATIGGSGVSSGATAEAGRFVYQSRTGDDSMTVFVPTPTPAQSGARFAVMVRGTALNTSPMAAAVTSGDATNFGAKLAYRTIDSAGASVLPSANNNHSTPRWLRLTRSGDTFTAESSADGTTWTTLGTASVTLPATALWGVFHYSADLATSTSLLGDYQLATFQNISLTGPPLPATPGAFAVNVTSATTIDLTWTAPANAAGYRIERRPESGIFAQIANLTSGATVSYSDTTAAADSAYEYRILTYNLSGESAWSSVLRATTPSGAPGLPTRPSFLTAAQGIGANINLQWTDNSSNETGFQIERRALNGSFALRQTAAVNATSFTDNTTLAGVIYEYRLCATGAAGNSAWTPTVFTTAAGTATGNQLWLQANGLPMDGSGAGFATASPSSDGFANLIKYALGLSAASSGHGGRLGYGTVTDAGSEYLSFTYIRPEPAPAGITYIVEASSDVAGWSTAGIMPVSSTVNGGLRTVTVRDGSVIGSGRRFMHLRVTMP